MVILIKRTFGNDDLFYLEGTGWQTSNAAATRYPSHHLAAARGVDQANADPVADYSAVDEVDGTEQHVPRFH